MFVGTGSDVGKSVINTAFCRIFKQDGYSPAPFKAQNMSLNSYATPEGLEIGRAQAVQAEACGIPCSVAMNPILLKPTNYMSSQVVLHGKPIGNKSASEYFNQTNRNALFDEAMGAYNSLTKKYNPMVIEGAGSISEMNLWDKDVTNMRVALASGAATYLVGDIDRGGVFASVYGTIALLPEAERDAIKGVIINKFRGDMALFEEGKHILESLTGKPVVGVVPYFRDIFVEQEDSVVIEHKRGSAHPGQVNVAVVLLRHLSNFTDFNMLEHQPGVHLYYTAEAAELSNADIIILPGSKNTIGDLQFIRERNLDKAILSHHQKGRAVYGICGGYQMMGMVVSDPHGLEGNVKVMQGLGLLPVSTVLSPKKKTEQCRFQFLDEPETGMGYEIHMGETEAHTPSPLCMLDNDVPDGYFLNPQTWGTYIHGIFDNAMVLRRVLQLVNPQLEVEIDYHSFKELNYNRLADAVRASVDMDYIYKTLKA